MASVTSDSELEILKVFWAQQQALMLPEIVAALHQKGFTWKNNTILTFLTRLADKKMITVKKKGVKINTKQHSRKPSI